MNMHPGKVSFQFTLYEVTFCDFNRFDFLFNQFDRLASHELPTMLEEFCGTLTLTYDPLLKKKTESPWEYPPFRKFAKELFERFTILPFLMNLEEEGFMVLLLSSFSELSTKEVDGNPYLKISFNEPEFSKVVIRAKENVSDWAKKAGLDCHQVYLLDRKVHTYLNRPVVSSSLGW